MRHMFNKNDLLNLKTDAEFWHDLTWVPMMDIVRTEQAGPSVEAIEDIGRALSSSGDLNLSATSLLDSDGDATSTWASSEDNFDIVTTADIADLSARIVDQTATGGSNGIVSESYTGSFLAISDTVNPDNGVSGVVTATFTFDISAVSSDLSVSIDWAAFGDFESSNDFFTVSASIDGGASQTLMTLAPDEAASQTYTFDDASSTTLDDPMQVTDDNGTTSLSNVFQSFVGAVTGTGSTLVLTISGQTDSGAEALVARNIVVSGETGVPVISDVETALFTYQETNGAQALTTTLTLIDADDTDLESASVAITGGFDMVNDSLVFTDQNGITGSYDAGLGVLTLTGTSTVANYQAALRSITYLNAFTTESTAARSFSFTVSDGTNDSNTENRNFDFNVDEVFAGTAADDTISGGFGTDTINGGEGNDDLSGDEGRDTIFGDDGDDSISGNDQKDIIDGGAGVDTIAGGTGGDIINGGDDNDVINGGVGEDTLRGDAGDDMIFGDGQDDLIVGGDGDDVLMGGGLNDTLLGQADNDTLFGNIGDDMLDGGGGDDVLNGNADNDTLIGGFGQDTLNGGGGVDILDGGIGNDTLFGGAANDTLNGGDGDDIINGDGGQDIITGGAGNDTLTSGNGSDQFLFSDNFGNDTITDFKNIADTIDFSLHTSFNSFADVSAVATQVGTDVVINLDANNIITLENFTLAQLDASDFAF